MRGQAGGEFASLACIIALATVLRLLIAASPAATVLQQRIETTSPADSPLRIREALFWVSQGQSPYAGWAYHGPPLVFPLWAPFVAPQAPAWLYVLPGCLTDVLTALLLYQLARLLHQALPPGVSRAAAGLPLPSATAVAALYLLNPYQVAATCSGASSACLETLALVAGLYGAALGSAPLAGVGLGAGAYLSPHAALLLPAMCLLLAKGPEPMWQLLPHATSPSSCSDGAAKDNSSSSGSKAVATTPSSPATATKTSPAVAGSSGSGRGRGKGPLAGVLPAAARLVVYSTACWALLALVSDLWLGGYPGHSACGGLLHPLGRALCPGWCESRDAAAAAAEGAQQHEGRGQRTLGGPAAAQQQQQQHWTAETYGFVLQVQDLTPNPGLWWYYFTELFPHFQPFFMAVLHMLAGGLALPLAVRLLRRPLLAAWCQVVVGGCMLRPYPTTGDLARAMALMPLMPQVVAAMSGAHMPLLLALALVSVLMPAMWHLWVVAASANSNYFWSMALLLGAWHCALLLLMIRSALRLDREVAGKVDKTDAVAKGR